MRIAQVVLDDATAYERKCQRVDLAALSPEHEVRVVALEEAHQTGASVAHLYAGRSLPSSRLLGFPLPYVASSDLVRSRWSLRKPAEPSRIVSPLFEKDASPRQVMLPEAVEDSWGQWRATTGGWRHTERDARTIASFYRPGASNLLQQTLARIGRVREDVTWLVFDRPPTPADLPGVDLWADPAVDDTDLDGYVAEALVAGIPVVAARTPINEIRLEQGRTGMLVRPLDPNEWTHAILTALFKPEVTEPRLQAAGQTVSKFRSRNRLRVLGSIYQTLTS